jgi:tetratricopeptide (TPR) repeat protein
MLLELEYMLFGLSPRGYHFTSLVLHSIVAVALYALFAKVLFRLLSPRTPGQRASVLCASLLGAAMFAVHPLRVEVVAWASCQPYLPCALFSLLAVLAYLHAFDGGESRRVGWMVTAWLLFLAAQLSKAVAVMLPVVLVVLDIAVLRRIGPDNWVGPSARRVWREKLPFFAVSAIFLVLAILAKGSNDSLISIQDYGPAARIAQSCYGIAKDYYLWALRIDPKCPDAYNLLGAVLDREGRRDEAMAHYIDALRIEPEYAAAQNNLGSALARKGRLDQAIARFAEAVRLKPDFAMARKNLAKALAQTGRVRKALPEFQEAARLAPDDANVRNDYGRALAQAGQLNEAIAKFAEAAFLDPRSAATQINWALALEQFGSFHESATHFAEAVRLEPDRVDNRLLLASALARQGKTYEAVSELEAALRLDPDNREVLEKLRETRTGSHP